MHGRLYAHRWNIMVGCLVAIAALPVFVYFSLQALLPALFWSGVSLANLGAVTWCCLVRAGLASRTLRGLETDTAALLSTGIAVVLTVFAVIYAGIALLGWRCDIGLVIGNPVLIVWKCIVLAVALDVALYLSSVLAD